MIWEGTKIVTKFTEMWPVPSYTEEKMQERKEDIDLEGQFWKRIQVYLDA